MIALIDADVVAYRCAASCKEEDPLDVAIFRVDKLMREIIEMVDAEEHGYHAFLSGKGNFRKVVNPDYKANRKDMVPPVFLKDCKDYLITEWKAVQAHGQEADDLLGIHQNDFLTYPETVICSIDKDLLMIPGNHFNWTKQQYGDVTVVDWFTGNKHFWKQMLIGDKTDNIFGVAGIGPVKAGKLIDTLDTNEQALEVVLEKYDNDYKRFAMNAACLWIKRGEDSSWHLDLNLALPNQLQQEADAMYESMKSSCRNPTSTEQSSMPNQESGSHTNGTSTEAS